VHLLGSADSFPEETISVPQPHLQAVDTTRVLLVFVRSVLCRSEWGFDLQVKIIDLICHRPVDLDSIAAGDVSANGGRYYHSLYIF
jgi:hypothetical protein